MLSFRTTARLLLAAVALSTAAAATPAMAADPDTPDQWQRWITEPGTSREAWVRSLDFIGPLLFAGAEGEGVFQSPTAPGPWSEENDGLKNIPGATTVHQVSVSPDGQVYAATSAGLFRSPAGQGGWKQVGGGEGPRKLNMGGVNAIKFNGPTGTDITVGVAGAGGAGVYYTSDMGEHWDRATGMNNPEAVYALATGPLQMPMYAAADNGVYASFNFGRSWILTSDGIPPGETTLRVAVSPTNPKDLYASTSGGVYTSWNGGITWDEAGGKDGQILPAGGKRAFLLTPDLSGQFGEDRAIVGTDSGVWGTLDNGEHWKPMTGRTFFPDSGTRMADRIVWSLNLGFTTPVIMAGTQGFGIFNTPIMPISGGDPQVAPATGLKVGTELKITNLDETNNNLDDRKYIGFKGTKPYFFHYQWRSCNTNLSVCNDITGATGSSYVIPDADANSTKRYYVKVTAKNLVKPTSIAAESEPTTGGVAAIPGSAPRPTFVSADQPKLSQNPAGQPYYDTTLSVSKGKWRTEGNATEIDPDVLKYRWERCLGATCTVLPNATGSTYKIGTGDIGYFVRAYITATEAGVGGDWFFVGGTNTVLNKFPVNTSAPTIVGDAWVGSRLGSTAGGWSGYDMTYERQWYRCEADGLGCNPITFPSQTGPTYTIGAADKGKRLKLQVRAIAYDPNQNRVTTVLSSATAVITDPPPPPVDPTQNGGGGGGGQQQGNGNGQQQGNGNGQVQPPKQLVEIKLPKKLKVGATLQVPKAVSGFKKLKFQWLRNGKKIKKATKRTYKLAKADRGKQISCQITMTPTGGGKAKVFKTLSVSIPKK